VNRFRDMAAIRSKSTIVLHSFHLDCYATQIEIWISILCDTNKRLDTNLNLQGVGHLQYFLLLCFQKFSHLAWKRLRRSIRPGKRVLLVQGCIIRFRECLSPNELTKTGFGKYAISCNVTVLNVKSWGFRPLSPAGTCDTKFGACILLRQLVVNLTMIIAKRNKRYFSFLPFNNK
jgi:hypothetical protein